MEALVGFDPRFGQDVAECFERDGDAADLSWRPDPRLLMDLPPGICDRYLAFPFRERAGKVEVATVSPLEDATRREFELHLRRPVVLYRGSVQALLAAAGASVDLNALNFHLSQPPPAVDAAALPLVRKSTQRPPPRQRTPTSPGMGRTGSSTSPTRADSSDPGSGRPPSWRGNEASDLAASRDVQELALALSQLLPAPALVFELRQGRLNLLSASGPGAYSQELVSLVEESALSSAVDEGSYLGLWYPCPVHERFASSYARETLVRVERIGSAEAGLVVTMAGEFDVKRAALLLRHAASAWRRVSERTRAY